MTAEHVDPFMPKVPTRTEPGRLETHHVLRAGWPCRICLTLLAATESGGVLCLNCDREPTPDE